ncbi:MAG TPA: hypothetical protein VJO33_11840, partial [Gemmatimonadaceae bacterium]|nr:hypothetical protein [Gemmatimonadaceae bacterium]
GPSQLSVYSRVNDRWQRSAGFVSHRQLLLYRIPGRDGPPVLATMETWTRADGSEGELKLWRVQDGLLRRIPRADTALFQDVDVEETDSALYLSSSQFPREVDACTMCTRLMHQHMFTASAGRVHEMKVSLTPWADLVDELYGELARGRVAAAQRLLLSPLRASELAGAGPRFHADTGDFEAGEGTAVVQLASSECDRTLRFRSRRQDDGRWLIVRVDRGRWNWDSDVFIPESKKSQTKGLCD